jgi:ATP-binding cassette subfamily F protein 3
VKSYGEISVYGGVDVAIERGSKLALVGPNGAGKSTLLKLLAGVEPLTAGKRTAGHNVRLAYFAQDQSAVLDPTKTVLEEMMAVTPVEMVPRVRDLLGAFLFSGDAVDKPVRVLSGGERNRLALAKLLIEPANCLLLDEPTNHLDLTAKEVLLEALLAYEGTVVLVAHDRYILDRLPSEIVEVGHGEAIRYLGNYEEYLAKKASQNGGGVVAPALRPATDLRPSAAAPGPASNGKAAREAERTDREAERRQARAAEKRAKEAATVESTIAAKEAELAELSQVMNDPDFYQTHPNPQIAFSNYARLKREVEGLYEKLERLGA